MSNSRALQLVALASMAGLAGGCGGREAPVIDAPTTLPVRSTSFADGGAIPERHTCDGEDLPPTLSWSVPPSVSEWALSMVDLDAGGFVHWVAYAIPAETAGVGEGRLPAGTKEGANDFGATGYGGPCPPDGDGPHRYEFTLYALRMPVSADMPAGASLDEVLEAIRCCVQVSGSLTGTYDRG
jgi:Raf kinase inhibitor-like YbhB/YbcL family protein